MAVFPRSHPPITRNPLTGEFIRVQPIGGFVFLSKGGLDGKWLAVTNDGKLEEDWKDPEKRKNLKKLGGIMRSPIFVDKGKRVLIPFHNMGGGTKFHISDDGGLTWRVSRSGITSPRHEAKPPHQGVRWFNNAVEATVLEMKDGSPVGARTHFPGPGVAGFFKGPWRDMEQAGTVPLFRHPDYEHAGPPG